MNDIENDVQRQHKRTYRILRYLKKSKRKGYITARYMRNGKMKKQLKKVKSQILSNV